MKTNKRVLTVIALIAFLLSVMSPFSAFAAGNSQSELQAFIFSYLDARHTLLSTGDSTDLASLAISGIVDDEISHRAYLAERNTTLPSVIYHIESVDSWDHYAIVKATEIAQTLNIGDVPYTVTHTLTVLINENGAPMVISDNYLEESTGFQSCSYVEEFVGSDVDPLAPARTNCFLSIAYQEIGYLEKASNSQLNSHTANPGSNNYTKYGLWYGSGYVNAEWCAMFVSWCANKANVPTTVIKKEAYVPYLASFFQNNSRYYASRAAGGSYTPKPGDIFFTTGYNHTGIVYSVSSSYITVIDGNHNNQVAFRNISLTDSSLLGFGSTAFTATDHAWTTVNGQRVCSNCGITGGSIA